MRSSSPRAVAGGAIMRANWPPPTTPITGKLTCQAYRTGGAAPVNEEFGIESSLGRGIGEDRIVPRTSPPQGSLPDADRASEGLGAGRSARTARRNMINAISDRLRGLVSLFWREVAKFGTVGGVAFVVDSAVFVGLLNGPMHSSEVWAKSIATVVASIFSWVANRYWTFRHRKQ